MSDLSKIAGPYLGPDKRIVRRKEADGTFKEVNFRDLKEGDEFCMFEPDNDEPVDGGRVYKAITDAHPPSLDGTFDQPWGIEVES